jgi:hypothetical protein
VSVPWGPEVISPLHCRTGVFHHDKWVWRKRREEFLGSIYKMWMCEMSENHPQSFPRAKEHALHTSPLCTNNGPPDSWPKWRGLSSLTLFLFQGNDTKKWNICIILYSCTLTYKFPTYEFLDYDLIKLIKQQNYRLTGSKILKKWSEPWAPGT